MQIKVKYIRDILEIERFEQGDYIDLRCGVDVTMEQGEYYQIPLGVAMELPEGYEALVVPRSSTFRKHGILMVNSVGVIDCSYCGPEDEWCFPAYATRDTVIKKNERICQFRILKNQPEIEFLQVSE